MKCLPAKGGIKQIMPKTRQAKSRGGADKSVEKAPRDGRYFSRAVGKAIQMLELLSRNGAPMSLVELSKQTQLTKSSAFRLLQTLETLHYIRRDANGHYLPSHENSAVVFVAICERPGIGGTRAHAPAEHGVRRDSQPGGAAAQPY